MIHTLKVDIPDGYELRYDVVKVNENRGKSGRPVLNKKDDPTAHTWSERNRERVQAYNKEYYRRKKEAIEAKKQNMVKEFIIED